MINKIKYALTIQVCNALNHVMYVTQSTSINCYCIFRFFLSGDQSRFRFTLLVFEHVIFSYEIPTTTLVHIVIIRIVITILLLSRQRKAKLGIPISLDVGSFTQPIPVATDVDATAAGYQNEREHGEIYHIKADGRDGRRGGCRWGLFCDGDGGREDGCAGKARTSKGCDDAYLGEQGGDG